MMDGPLLMENVTSLFFRKITTTQPMRPKGARCEDVSSVMNSLQILSLFFFSLAFLLGVTGNGLVIWITGFKMKTTVNTVWFLNLSIADFIFTFFLPISIAYTAMDYHWPFGTLLCKINSTVGILNMFASIFFLVVISVDRCLLVVFPVWSQNHRTPRMATKVALTTWVLALAMSSPALAFRDTLRTRNNTTLCYNNYAFSTNFSDPQIASVRKMRNTVLTFTNFLCGFLFPFIIIFVCYGILIFRLRRNQRARSSKPYKIMCAVVLSFFCCWLPNHFFLLLRNSLDQQSSCLTLRIFRIGSPVAASLAYFSSCINPVIYVFIVRDFKNILKSSVLSVLEMAFKEESTIPQSRTTSVQQDEKSMMMPLESK
ncbi:chemerin-like receptor 1 [Pleurodeles waltl]|uniref:chemerin-like receptor 1 n=1 Tax=Pleurodeles waltl TaxID=8319 RepID=UPI0037098935